MATNIVVVEAEDRQLGALARSAGLNVTSIVQVSDLASAERNGASPGTLIVDLRNQAEFPQDLVAFKRRHVRTSIIMVLSHLDPAIMVEAMRAGVTEVVSDPVSAADLRAAANRVAGQQAAPTAHGKILVFVGAKGGVGTTTLAVNVATALALDRTANVLMADLHATGHGDAALFLGVEPRFSVVDAIENVHRLDEAFLRSLVVRSKAGLDVLASPERPTLRQPDGQQLRALLDRLSAYYDYLVIDLPRSDLAMVDAIEPVTSVILVVNQELPTVRRAAQIASLLRQRYGKDRVACAVSRYDGRADIGQDDIERVVGLPVWAVLPSDYRRAVSAANSGQPFVGDHQSRLGTSIKQLASKVSSLSADEVGAAAPARVVGRRGGIF